MEGWSELHPLVKSKLEKTVKERYGTVDENKAAAYELMKIQGITDKIPSEDLTTKGYGALSNIRKGQQKLSKRRSFMKY